MPPTEPASTRIDFTALPKLLTFTVDVEDHRPPGGGTGSFTRATAIILDFLDEYDARGTFFIVGEAAARAPGLVREIAHRGHEIGSHAHEHAPLPVRPPPGFRRALGDSRRLLEDIAGMAVPGFRAPHFSLTRHSAWALDAIREAGFGYSSSVLPGPAPGFSWRGVPRGPFLWCDHDLLELPCPTGTVGPLHLPCLGGLYLRLLPPWRMNGLLRRLRTDIIWTYCHPYDFDLEESLGWVRAGGPLASFVLWWRRPELIRRLRAILAGRRSVPFASRLPALRAVATPYRLTQP
jgi:polysaccharide deacetylase family protein (PEP-CTERM system associated)